MNSGIADFLGIGIPAVVAGMLVLGLMVQRELGPFAGLGPGGKWLLSGALGMGLLAFVLKIGVAVALSSHPESTVDRLTRNGLVPLAMPDDGRNFANPMPPRPRQYVWETLPGQVPEPADNPSHPAKVALGRRLFEERRLSGDGTLSCASCHDLDARAGDDGRPTARGIAGQVGSRNVPTVWNAAFQAVLFWDGRAPSLEAQAGGPILNPIEMGLASPAEAERRLAADPAYRTQFAQAFGDATISFARIVQAIAAFERTLIAADTPYDRFVRGDLTALTPAQRRGMALFESVGCVLCHRGANFSDASLLGGEYAVRYFPATPTRYDGKYPLLIDGKPGVWRVPSLRNVALTGPWLHNGSVDRLDEVVRIMAAAQLGRSGEMMTWLDADSSLDRIDRSPLGEPQVADLVAFLEALSSDRLRAKAPAGSSTLSIE